MSKHIRPNTPEHSVAGNSMTTERPDAAASIVAKPEFGGFDQLRTLFQIPRSTAYELEKAGEIRFIRMRKRGHARARVLVDLDSVRRYLDRCRNEKPGPAVPRKEGAQ